MILNIAKYTIHYKINRILICVFFACIVSLCILQNNSYIKWFTLFLIFIVIFYYQLTKSNIVTGFITITKLSNGAEYCINQGIGSKLDSLIFVDGGFKGKERGVSLLFLPNSRFKDGANNYLIINEACKVQIMLKDKKEYQNFVDFLTEIQQSGVKVQKIHYLIFEIKRFCKLPKNIVK